MADVSRVPVGMANVRSFLDRKKPRKPGREKPAEVFLPEEQNTLWVSAKGGWVEASTVLEFVPQPMALWSHDRRLCAFNNASRQLLGFCEHDFYENGALWLERILPRDRGTVSAEWKKLLAGENRVSLLYRFLPKHRSGEIRIREVAVPYPIAGDATGVWSVYSEDPAGEDEFGAQHIRELLRGLTHEIGNSLQSISGELDLLRLSGVLSADNSTAVTHGVRQIRRLAHEIEEYLSPRPLQLKAVDPATVLDEVIHGRQDELVTHNIRIGVVLRERLPKVPLDEQFRSALERVIDFSCALLPQGGELKIEAGLQRVGDANYIELKLLTESPTSITVEEKDVFRPFLKVNGCRVGLSMAVARQILRRHFGKIVFRKERFDQGVFSILIRVPAEP